MAVLKLYVGSKYVGEIDTELRVLRKRVYGSKHFLQVPPAIAIDAGLYDKYREKFDVIEVTDLETQRVYRVSASRFDRGRIVIDRGFGRQYALPLSVWVRDDNAVVGQMELGLEV